MKVSEEIEGLVDCLKNGGVALYPTDTIWGLGSDMNSKAAVDRIYTIKNRSRDKPLILLVSGLEMLKNYVPAIHPRLETLLSHFDKPLTVVYPQVAGIPSWLRSEKGEAAIRVVRDEYCQQVIDKLGNPLTSTSANQAGRPFPKHFGEIQSDIMQQVDFISNYRREDKTAREPSVIIRCHPNGEFEFLRE